MDDIKYFIPIVTFIAGILATPWVETLKERRKAKLLKEEVWTELNDELTTLMDSIKKTDKSISNRKVSSETTVLLSLPAKVDLLLLTENINLLYPLLTREQRLSIKNVIRLQDSINESYGLVLESYKTSNSKAESAEEAMLYSKLSLYMLLLKLTNEKENYVRYTRSNDDLVFEAANKLKIKNAPSKTA